MHSQKINTIKRRFPKEWLLISLDKIDEATTTPISGRLIAHSPHRYEVYAKLLAIKRKRPVLVEYSEDTLPKGFVAAF